MRSGCLIPATMLAVLVVLAACTAGTSAPVPASDSAPVTGAVAADELDLQASLLLLNDRQIWERSTIERASEASASTRRLLALTFARLADPRSVDALEVLLLDEAPEVRRAAAFASGRVPSRRSEGALLRAVGDEDRATGIEAVSSSARIGVSLAAVLERLDGLAPGEVEARLLPALHLFGDGSLFEEDEKRAIAEIAVESADATVRGRAAFALTSPASADQRPLLVELLSDSDPWVRLRAARGLGVVGDAVDIAALFPLLGDGDGRVVGAALEAASALIDRGLLAAPGSWRPRLLALIEDPRPMVRSAAIEASSRWLLDEALGTALVEIARNGELPERRSALLALARGGDPRTSDLIVSAAGHEDVVLRTAAARLGPLWLSPGLQQDLESDPEPAVRQASFEARLAFGEPSDVLRRFIIDPDGGVRAAALAWLGRNPVLPVETLVPMLSGPGREVLDLSLRLVDALVARALLVPEERGIIVAVLEQLADARDYLIRRQAIDGLAALDRPVPEPGPVAPLRPIDIYRDVVRRTTGPRTVVVETAAGRFAVELRCRDVPLSCLHFLQLVGNGFYDGLRLHRVEPGVAVEGGDPRGDGWGGPGFRVRDEAAPGRYVPGTVLLSRERSHTGGSRFLILLEERPDLEGGMTPLGQVSEGLEIVRRLRLGDRIESIRLRAW